MKKCPFCAEDIQEEAIKCRFCNEFLDGRLKEGLSTKKTEWYFKTSTLIAGFCFVGPLIIPLIWFHPHYSQKKKMILIGACVVLTIVIYKSLQTSFCSIGQYYQMLEGNY